MKTVNWMRAILLLTLVLATTLTTSTPATAASSATLTIRVAPEGFVVPSHWLVGNEAVWLVDPCADTSLDPQPGIACCNVTVPDANGDGRVDGAEALDVATLEDCIAGWAAADFGFGRLVTCVDGLCKQGPTDSGWPVAWWLLQIDGFASPVGIDDMDLSDGQSLEFVYYIGG